MSYESTIYTLGNVLSRAEQEHLPVEVLVDGTWLTGNVAIHDGTGLVLDRGEEHAIVKVTAISAVRVVGAGFPGQRMTSPATDEAMPMPGPREAEVDA